MAVLQAGILAVVALIITPGFLFYFDVTPKVTLLLVGAAALLLLGRPEWSRFHWLLLLGWLSLAISTAFSANPALSAFGTNWRRLGTVEYGAIFVFVGGVAAHVSGRPGRLRIILRGVSLTTLLAALYGISQYFGYDPWLPQSGYHIGEGIWTIVRPPSTFGYVSYFANWLVFAVFLNLALASIETNVKLRYLAWGGAALAAFALILTGTRAAMVGLLAGLAYGYIRRGARLNRRVVLGGAAAVLVLAGFYYSPAGWPLRSRTRWFIEDPRGGARLYLWRDSLRMALDRLPVGYGPEVFTAQFPRYASLELAVAFPNFAHESPHNMFLDAFVGQGIPGLAILVAICWFALRGRAEPWFAAALAGGLVAQQFTVFTAPTALIFYLTVALASPAPVSLIPKRIWFPLAVPVSVALLVVATRLFVSDYHLERSRQAAAARGIIQAAAQYRTYDRWRLPGTGADLWYSRAMTSLAGTPPYSVVRLQAAAQAGLAALRATKTAEDPFNAWYTVAQLYSAQGDAANAERSLRQAVAASPRWFKPHWMLARLLQLENRHQEACAAAALAARLNGNRDREVTETWRQIQLSH
ncbi:MAG TPA: O-antigen ligase family protein [Bryobacteraceae bacterium]|nr:O-antigen ligase family protein [Bryobacteraceae bacterium]